MNTERGGFTAGWRSWWPELGGAALVLLLVLYPTSGLKSAVVWLGLFGSIMLARRNGRPWNAGGMGALLIGYGLVVAVTSWFSIDPSFSFRQVMKLVENMAAFLVVVNLAAATGGADRALRWFAMAMSAVAGLDTVRLIRDLAAGSDLLRDDRWFGSLLGYPTIAAAGYGVALMIMMAPLLHSRTWGSRLGVFGVMAVMLVILYFLQTRSVVLGLLIGAIVFIALAPVDAIRQAAVLGGVAAVLGALLLIPGAFRERLLSGGSPERAAIGRDAERLVREGVEREPFREWVGFGYGHKIFEKLHKTLPRREREASRVYDHAHNLLTETKVQSGAIGLLALGGMATAALFAAWRGFPPRTRREERMNAAVVSGALAVVLVYAQFSLFYAYLPALLFWALFGLWTTVAARPR
ncbi:MAG TPA: hypothetical protein PKE26_16475 [Kiritimatiellia bacterium]|nr:hypothetical protein [Kiritimatiellia bacterium]HMP00693.1 hypothetical protein [Kiritimatiellia bacterium]HMP98051.1 hypothetical protein [Kiritimatiellia bacterium]